MIQSVIIVVERWLGTKKTLVVVRTAVHSLGAAELLVAVVTLIVENVLDFFIIKSEFFK